MDRRTGAIIAGLCLLAACGPKPGQTAAPSGAANPAAGAPATGGAAQGGADQVIDFSALPRPRAGLWQQVEDDGDGKPTTTTTCLSGRMPTVKQPQTCSQFTVKRTILGAYVMDINCVTPQATMTSHTQMQGDFQNSMSGDMTMTLSIPGHPPQTSTTHSVYRYLGPCAPGQAPDDDPGDAATG